LRENGNVIRGSERNRMQTAPVKIALGVFLGVAGAWLAIKAPRWISESLRQSRNDRAAEVLSKLDADRVAAACGKPGDEYRGDSDRSFTYWPTLNHGVLLTFHWVDRGPDPSLTPDKLQALWEDKLETLWHDPDFLRLPADSQMHVLGRSDAGYAALSAERQARMLKKMRATFVWGGSPLDFDTFDQNLNELYAARGGARATTHSPDAGWRFTGAAEYTRLPNSAKGAVTADDYREVVAQLPCLSKAQR